MAYIGVSPSNGVRQKHTYTATASQTTFSGAGSEGISLSYRDSNYVDVYRNGVKLGDADYTATSGTSIVLGEGAAVNDIVEIVVYDVFSVADTVSKADGGTFDGNVAMAGTLAVTGETTLSTHLNMGDNDIIKLGDSAELQIYSDGTTSIIRESGSGGFLIDGANIQFRDAGGGFANFANFSSNGAVSLYWDGNLRFATTSVGIQVDGPNPEVRINDNNETGSTNLKFHDSVRETAKISVASGTSANLQVNMLGTPAFKIDSNNE